MRALQSPRAGWPACVFALAALFMHAVALAGVPSLIAGLHRGDELRYAYTLSTEEVTSITGKVGPESRPTRVVSTQTVFVVFRVIADTTAATIVEATFENAAVSMQTGDVAIAIDAGPATPPGEDASPGSRDLYAWFHPLVGAKLTLNIAPGSGEITSITGGEELLRGVGGPHLRRFLDPDLFRANFGCVFQLKSNSQMPPPGQKWYVKTHAYGRGVKAPVWETRVVESESGSVATIKAVVKASSKPDDSTKTPVFFRGVSADNAFWWDTASGRLTKAVRSEVIQTRYEVAPEKGASGPAVRQDSDMTCRGALEMIEKTAPKPDARDPATPPATDPPSSDPKKTP